MINPTAASLLPTLPQYCQHTLYKIYFLSDNTKPKPRASHKKGRDALLGGRARNTATISLLEQE